MIHPLVQDGDRTIRCGQVGDGVLGEYSYTVGGDHLRDAVVDLRVNVIGTACKDNALDMVFLHEFQDFLSLFANISAGLFEFLPAGDAGLTDFLGGNLSGKFLFHGIGDGAHAGESHEGVAEPDLSFRDLLDVIADVLRIGGDDRAVVVVVRGGKLRALIEQGGVEDEVNALFNEPHHVTVRNLGRVARGLAGDGFNSHLVDPVCGQGREDHAVTEFCEEGRPEGVILVHIQYTGDSDRSPVCLTGREGTIAEYPAQLIFIEVGHIVLCRFLAQAPLAAVAGDKQALLGLRGMAAFRGGGLILFVLSEFPVFLLLFAA